MVGCYCKGWRRGVALPAQRADDKRLGPRQRELAPRFHPKKESPDKLMVYTGQQVSAEGIVAERHAKGGKASSGRRDGVFNRVSEGKRGGRRTCFGSVRIRRA